MSEKSNSFAFQYIAVAGLIFIILNLFYAIPNLEFFNTFFNAEHVLTALIICFLLALCFTDVLTQLVGFGVGITIFSYFEWLPQPLLIIIAFIIALVVYKVVRG